MVIYRAIQILSAPVNTRQALDGFSSTDDMQIARNPSAVRLSARKIVLWSLMLFKNLQVLYRPHSRSEQTRTLITFTRVSPVLPAEDLAVSIIDCDYLPTDKVVFPPELALLIVRKASAMAAVLVRIS